MAQLEIRLDPHGPVYTPGEMIKGHLLLTCESTVNANGIDVELVGTCATRAWARRNDNDDKDRRSDSELVMETIEFLLVQFQPNESGPFATGQHQIDFVLQVPQTCSSRAISPEWRGTPLPSSVEDVHPDGIISYALHAKVRCSGIFSRNVKAKRQINMRSRASHILDPDLLSKKKFVQQKVDVQLYDTAVERWSDWTLRVLGQPTASHSIPYRIKLSHSGVGLPAMDVPLSKVATLHVYKLESGDTKKSTQIELEALEVSLVYTVACRAQDSTSVNTRVVHLLKHANHDQIHFSGDDRSADLTHLLDQARLRPHFVSETSPNVTVKATLRVDVGLVPTVGNPVKAVYARLDSEVPIYWCPDGQLPAMDDAQPPPYDGPM